MTWLKTPNTFNLFLSRTKDEINLVVFKSSKVGLLRFKGLISLFTSLKCDNWKKNNIPDLLKLKIPKKTHSTFPTKVQSNHKKWNWSVFDRGKDNQCLHIWFYNPSGLSCRYEHMCRQQSSCLLPKADSTDDMGTSADGCYRQSYRDMSHLLLQLAGAQLSLTSLRQSIYSPL